jgi:hypothetical protein
VGDDVHINNKALLVTDFVNLKIKLAQSFKCDSRSRIRVCVHRGECSYVYEYLSLYYVLKKRVLQVMRLLRSRYICRLIL